MKKKNILSVFLILTMCLCFCACGKKEEKNPLVGEWRTEFIIEDDGTERSRAEMIEIGASLYIDVIINEDMTYLFTLGDGMSEVSGAVSTKETNDGKIYSFLEAGMSGMIDPENPKTLIITGEALKDYTFILVKK